MVSDPPRQQPADPLLISGSLTADFPEMDIFHSENILNQDQDNDQVQEKDTNLIDVTTKDKNEVVTGLGTSLGKGQCQPWLRQPHCRKTNPL